MDEVTRFQRSQPGEAAQRARDVDFPVTMRGYDRHAVDAYVEEMAQLVESLEATQARETVVQRALDEVGEQTSGILQRAHETGEEITARSRAKAEGRLQRAEREAEILRRDADEYADRIVSETRLLWEERQRLIEEMRQLADEVLGIADDAAERVSEPEMLQRREAVADEAEPGPGPAADPTTVMPALEGLVEDGPYDPAIAEEAALAEEAPFDSVPDDGSEDATIAAEPPPPVEDQPTEEVDALWAAPPEEGEADDSPAEEDPPAGEQRPNP